MSFIFYNINHFDSCLVVSDSIDIFYQPTHLLLNPFQVEALTLRHDEGAFEVACNLLDPSSSSGSPEAVLTRALSAIQEQGLDLEVHQKYTTGPSEAELLAMLGHSIEKHQQSESESER